MIPVSLEIRFDAKRKVFCQGSYMSVGQTGTVIPKFMCTQTQSLQNMAQSLQKAQLSLPHSHDLTSWLVRIPSLQDLTVQDIKARVLLEPRWGSQVD